MDGQTNIFEMLYENYKIKTPIKMIELFAGYGATSFGWKYMNIPFEHHKICEWAVNSIQAYKDAHMPDDNNDYSKDKTKEELIEILYKYGISSNYNEPMKYEQIERMNETKIRTIYNNIIATHNLVNVQNVSGSDLQIKDTNHFTYLLTYSFPCQDLSLSGKGKGMSDTTTRSGMLWEVERILNECKELPQILLMENVPQIHAQENLDDFNKWQLSLEKFGYKNYWQDLIATDYGIPQTRNRCFMISILGDYNYTFPKKIPLKLKLRDMLEDEVDEKYFISDEMEKFIYKNIKYDYNNYIEYERYNNQFEQNCRVWKDQSPSLHTMSNQIKIFIKNNNKKGYLEASDGDCIDLCQPNSKTRRGRVQKEKVQTITTMCGKHLGVLNNMRIRRITPLEAFRLMGVKDEDFKRIAKHQSNASLYHLAGDSIVVDVIKAIYGELI